MTFVRSLLVPSLFVFFIVALGSTAWAAEAETGNTPAKDIAKQYRVIEGESETDPAILSFLQGLLGALIGSGLIATIANHFFGKKLARFKNDLREGHLQFEERYRRQVEVLDECYNNLVAFRFQFVHVFSGKEQGELPTLSDMESESLPELHNAWKACLDAFVSVRPLFDKSFRGRVEESKKGLIDYYIDSFSDKDRQKQREDIERTKQVINSAILLIEEMLRSMRGVENGKSEDAKDSKK